MTKKIIPFEINLKSSQRAGFTFQPRPQILTNDANSAELNFIITDASSVELTGSSATVLLFMKDGSFFQNTDVTRVNNTFVYTVKPNQAKHRGVAQAQLVIKIGSVENASPLMEFEIIGGLETKPIVERDIQDWTSLTAEAKAFVDQIEGFTLESFVENKMGQELANLEVNYAGRLTGLESADQTITAQLAQIVQQELPLKANITDVANISSGTPLFADSVANMTDTTRVYANTTDGLIYVYNGVSLAFEATTVQYQSTGIADNSIKPENTTFISSTKNKFNKNDVIKGAYINNANVVTSGTSASGFDCHTGYIEVIAGETYHRNKLSNVLMYDENYAFSNVLTPNTGTFTPNKWVSGSIKYIRMSMAEADLDEFQLELGSVETSYEPYGLKINDLIVDIDVSTFQTELDTLQTDVSALQSLNQTIPEYFQTEILNTVQKVEDVTTEPSLVLSILTDSHSDQMGDNFKYLKETANNIAEVNKYIQSDAIIHLGDLVAGTLPLATTKGSIRTVATELRNTNIPSFVLRGNHDDNSYGVDNTIPNLLLSDGFYPLGTRQTNIYNNVYRNANSNYGYIDYEQHKIRVIMLDAIDYPYAENGEGGLTYNGKNWWGYGTEQILWFGHTALKVEEGWGVVVLSHTPSRESHSLINRSVPYNSNFIEGLLKAFKNGSIYTANTTGDWGVDDSFDFTIQGQKDVIAYVFGHTHMDLVDTPIDLGYPCVSLASNVPVQAGSDIIPSGGVAPARTIGTVTQDLWSVMVVRKDIRTVFLTRYGAGGDRQFTY